MERLSSLDVANILIALDKEIKAAKKMGAAANTAHLTELYDRLSKDGTEIHITTN